MILALARGVHVAAVLSLFGALLHGVAVARPACAGAGAGAAAAGRGLRRLAWGSLLLALASGAAWLLLVAGGMADATRFAAMLAAVPAVLFGTFFGTVLLWRLGLLLLAGVLAGAGRPALALLPAAGALAAQSWMGHPAAAGDAVLVAASVLHILAAGAWLGGLVPLWLLVGALPGPHAARAAARFFWIGFLSILVLAATAFWQGRRLIGSEAGLLGTHYGHLALLKLFLLVLLLALAARNRLHFAPALAGAGAAEAGLRLRRSILAATVLGFAVVLVAGLLASEAPADEAAE